MEKTIHSTIKVAIKGMNWHDSKSCPIKLENLTFAIFTEYLLSLRPKKKRKKRQNRRMKTVECESEGKESSASSTEGTSEEERYLSKSIYWSSRSIMMHLYRGCGTTIPDRFQKELANFTRVTKREVAKQKENLGTKADAGKRLMSFHVYEKLCQLMMESEDDEYIFGQWFLTVEWNLMARSDNIVQSHVNHLEWRDNCLLYYMIRTKGDQDGNLSTQHWYVYANPHAPHICSVLALAIYVLANSTVTKDSKLFQRFSKVLRKCLEDNEVAFNDLGVEIYNTGSHSSRKGSATYYSTGSIVSPPMASICWLEYGTYQIKLYTLWKGWQSICW